MTHKISMFRLLVLAAAVLVASYAEAEEVADSTAQLQEQPVAKKSFFKKVKDTFVGMDTAYCAKAAGNFGIELMDKMQQERVDFSSPDGHRFSTSSRFSNRVGPYIGYKGFYAGATFDLFMSKAKNRSEITINLNSQLCNVELIRRRTGGDFRINEFKMHRGVDVYDMTSLLTDRNIGDYFTNKLTGVNVNFFTNHRRYSNPAGFTRCTIQKRSAGSWIIGAGYTRQKMHFVFFDDNDVNDFIDMGKEYVGKEPYGTEFIKYLMDRQDDEDHYNYLGLLFTRSPSHMTVDDLHLHVGYAYNWTITRRLLLAVQGIVAPSAKWIQCRSDGTVAYTTLKRENTLHELDDVLAPFLKDRNIPFDPDNIMESNYSPFTYKSHALDLNYIGRISLNYRVGSWRIGTRAQYNAYNYKHSEYKLRNHYWDARFYVGFSF